VSVATTCGTAAVGTAAGCGVFTGRTRTAYAAHIIDSIGSIDVIGLNVLAG
jgi:hypothetical protein